MRKVAYKQDSAIDSFPGLMVPKRIHAVNDNYIPMLGLILKHVALMSLAFGVFYIIHLLV